MLFILASIANAGTVVATGGGIVAAPPKQVLTKGGPASWVSVLADCLEEAQPGKHAVVDRSAPDMRAASAEVQRLGDTAPDAMVVTLGAAELAQDDVSLVQRKVADVVRRMADVPGPLLLVGLVTPTVSQLDWAGEDGAARQAAIDEKTKSWNIALQKLAAADDGVWYVDPRWPADVEQRKAFTRSGWLLTDPGHAHLGAVICDELLKALAAGPR